MRLIAALALVLSSAAWGFAFPPLKALLQRQSAAVPGWWASLQIQTLRFAIAGVLLVGLAVILQRRGPTRPETLLGLILGALVGIGMYLQIDALQHTGAAVVGFITQAYVVWVPLAVALLARRLPTWSGAAAAVLVMIGVGLLSGIRPGELRLSNGALEVLAASLLFAAQILVLEQPRFAKCDGLQVTWVMMAAMTVAGLILVTFTGPGIAGIPLCYPDSTSIWLLVAISVVATAMPFWAVNTFQKLLSSPVASILYTSEAVAAAIAAATLPVWLGPLLGVDYLNEPIGLSFWVAAILILGGCALAQLPDRRRVETS